MRHKFSQNMAHNVVQFKHLSEHEGYYYHAARSSGERERDQERRALQKVKSQYDKQHCSTV